MNLENFNSGCIVVNVTNVEKTETIIQSLNLITRTAPNVHVSHTKHFL